MKVLVTGATSGLGRNAVEYLRNKGHQRASDRAQRSDGQASEQNGAEFIPADLTELVSSQAKVMLAVHRYPMALLQLYLAMGHSAGFRSR